jgi:DNA-binding CsgD family transcriptional regulator
MDEATLVSNLIGDIYDAVLDRSLWVAVLEKLCKFVTAQNATLAAQSGGQIHFYHQWGLDPQFLETLHRTYSMINPLYVPVMLYSKAGEVQTVGDLVPFDEFLKSRFYKEWAAPQGLGDAIWMLVEKSAAGFAGLSAIRNTRDGPFDDESKRRIRLLSPHFRRAITIGRIVDLHKFEAAALADSLDGLATAMFLVDARGHLVHVNVAGHALLDKADVVRAADGKFAAVDAQANGALRNVFIDSEHGDRAVSTKGIDVPLAARNGDRYVAHVLPLASGARRQAGVAYSAVAAVFVRKAELELPHPLETIANVFKLTSAEMRVLMMVVQLGGAREVAPVLGISEPTVRTHLQHIFDKTNTSRQADLVKLVAGYMSPLGT